MARRLTLILASVLVLALCLPATAQAHDRKRPSRVTGLRVAAGDHRATLTWRAARDNRRVTAYRVRRSAYPSMARARTLTRSARTRRYVAKGLTNGRAYYFTVAARDAAGNWGRPSVAVRVVPRAPVRDTAAPGPVSGLRAIARTADSVTLAWDAAADDRGVTDYEVELDGLAYSAAASPRTHVARSTTPNREFAVRVRAADAAGNLGPWSPVLPARTLETLPYAPLAPVTYPSYPDRHVTVAWMDPEGYPPVAVGFDLERDGVLVASGTGLYTWDDGLPDGTAHAFRVRAWTAWGGRGPWSDLGYGPAN